jgi:hypothetical protein
MQNFTQSAENHVAKRGRPPKNPTGIADTPDLALPAARRKQRNRMSPLMVQAWRDALSVTPQAVASYKPVPLDMQIAEALLAGMSSPQDLATFAGVPRTAVTDLLRDSLAMAWISKQVHAHMEHRLGLVDAALFNLAVAGNLTAIRTVYDRLGKLQHIREVNHHHNYSGGIDLTALTLEDLRKLAADKARVIDVPYKIIEEPKCPTSENNSNASTLRS